MHWKPPEVPARRPAGRQAWRRQQLRALNKAPHMYLLSNTPQATFAPQPNPDTGMLPALTNPSHLLAVLQGGMEVVREVRRRWPKSRTRIVAVTADAFEDTRDSCIAVGFDGWLAKPFRVEEFAKVRP